jgi:hypothetical protein
LRQVLEKDSSHSSSQVCIFFATSHRFLPPIPRSICSTASNIFLAFLS